MVSTKDKSKKNARDIKAPRKRMSDNGFLRLGHKAGVHRISKSTHEINLDKLEAELTGVIRDALIMMTSENRKTISIKDVLSATARRGQTLYGFE